EYVWSEPENLGASVNTAGSEFVAGICAYLEPKRQVTAEVYLRGPEYVGLTISAGFESQPGYSPPDVRDRVSAAVRAFLSPLPAGSPDAAHPDGWPLEKPVNARELLAVVSRVAGVRSAADVLLAGVGSATAVPEVTLTGLQLPRVDRLSVTVGPPVPLGALTGGPSGPSGPGRKALPVPVIPREC
ncbi:MAG: hypothetical protein K2V38_25430, partial [Gemmataceae bacterium]|nr:hypothetical protein [Gemmataceae bacterium]